MPDIFVSKNAQTAQDQDYSDARQTSLGIKNFSQVDNEDGSLLAFPKGHDIHLHPDHNHSPFSSYCFYPDKLSYSNLDDGEQIILLLRKHPITNLPWFLVSFLMVIAPSFFFLIPFFEDLPSGYGLIIVLSWYLVTTAYTIEKFLSWFFNIDVITDERIMDIHFVNLMYREITEARLDQIQEITVKPASGIYSFFHFGSVSVQTAAEKPRLEFAHIPKPEKVAKILRELVVQEEVEKLEGRVR
jgi:hypothetical protein